MTEARPLWACGRRRPRGWGATQLTPAESGSTILRGLWAAFVRDFILHLRGPDSPTSLLLRGVQGSGWETLEF